MNTPTKLTVVRIVLIPIFMAVFLIDPIPYGKFIALAIFALACATDWLDGYLARKNDQVTTLGKFLDSIADKLLITAGLIMVILKTKEGYAMPIAVISTLIISRELVISGVRQMAAAKGVILAADMLGKIKAVLQMIALILLLPYADILNLHVLTADIIFYVGFVFLCLSGLMGIISALNYIIKNREVFE